MEENNRGDEKKKGFANCTIFEETESDESHRWNNYYVHNKKEEKRKQYTICFVLVWLCLGVNWRINLVAIIMFFAFTDYCNRIINDLG